MDGFISSQRVYWSVRCWTVFVNRRLTTIITIDVIPNKHILKWFNTKKNPFIWDILFYVTKERIIRKGKARFGRISFNFIIPFLGWLGFFYDIFSYQLKSEWQFTSYKQDKELTILRYMNESRTMFVVIYIRSVSCATIFFSVTLFLFALVLYEQPKNDSTVCHIKTWP